MSSSERRRGALRSVALVALVAFASGCGFQLQGRQTLPPEMQRTRLVADDEFTEFYRGLRSALLANGVELVETAEATDALLSIRRDETGQRVLSVSAQNVPREFEVFYTISYDLRIDGEIRSGATDLTLTRDYTWDETEILGKVNEEAVLRDALVDELVQAVIRRLSYTE